MELRLAVIDKVLGSGDGLCRTAPYGVQRITLSLIPIEHRVENDCFLFFVHIPYPAISSPCSPLFFSSFLSPLNDLFAIVSIVTDRSSLHAL